MEDWDNGDDQGEEEEDDMLGGDDEDVEEEDILDMEDEAPPMQDVLLMRFCPHDSSMLYPQVSADWSPIVVS